MVVRPDMVVRFGLPALLLLPLAALVAADAALLDGELVEGPLALSGERRIALGEREIALADLDWLRVVPDGVPGPERDPDLPVAILADGGWLPQRGVVPGSDAVAFLTDFGRLEFDLGEVVAWGPPSWLESAAGEGDRVLLADGEFAGAVIGIADGQLSMDVDELGELQIAFDRVRGIWLDLPLREPEQPVVAAGLVQARPPVLLMPGSEGPRLMVAPEVVLDRWPGGRLRVHGGRRVWLGDLRPASVVEEGAFGVTWPYRVDENFDGQAIAIDGEVYLRGLVVHSRAELAWELAGDYERFQAVIGLEDSVADEGDCAVRLLVDGEERWADDALNGSDPPATVELDLSGAETLTLEIGFGARYDIGDHVALGDAWLVRSAER